MPEIKDWRNRVKRYRLISSKCKKCGEAFYPPRRICRNCGSREMDLVELPERGRLITFSVIRVPPTKYVRQAPYVVGVVELSNGVRVLAQLTDVELEGVKEGMEVEATLRKLYEYGSDGHIVYGVKFRPVIR